MSRSRPLLTGAAFSLLVHGLATVVLLALPPARTAAKDFAAARDPLVDLDPLEATTGGSATQRGHLATRTSPAEAGGSTALQNIDGRDPGEGGDVTGALVGMRLMIEDDRVLLFDSPLNNVAAAQLQRIRTANDQATLERRRATPNPHDQPFLASGDGTHRERRPLASVDANEGARVAPTASVEGALPSIERAGAPGTGGAGDVTGAPGARASASAGPAGAEASPGRGILDGRGERASDRARVAFGRPAVDQGPAATVAANSDSQVRDDVDSEQLAREMMQSWVDATGRTSRVEGAGRGGVSEGGSPGSGGGVREGGRASPYGPGDGRFSALDTNDSRYRLWFLQASRRVHDALRFPRERALAMDQGTTIYMLSVGRDGRLQGAPRLVRTSGFDDLDRAALAAIRQATPFSPVPDDIAPGLGRIPIRLPVEFSNPMVQ
ncbi:MAG: TonB family protein [Sandaracinaceae bacterium]|nr:TonB family protein [Sandaracinaceae bacterium]